MNKANGFLSILTKDRVDQLPELLNSEWAISAFIQFCHSTHLAPLYHQMLRGALEERSPILTALGNTRNQVLVRNMRLQQVFSWLLTELNTKRMDVVPLKGIYASEKLYGDISLRHLSDMDMLVKEKDMAAIVVTMARHGWSVKKAKLHSELADTKLKVAHPYTFYKEGVVVELHTHLYDNNYGAQISAEEVWQHTHEEPFLCGTIRQFGAEFLLQHWCNHLHKHLTGHEVKMLSFWDIRLLLGSESQFNWHVFEQLCENYRCKRSCFSVLWLCAKHWGVTIPESCQIEDAQLEGRFLDFLEARPKTVSHMAEHRLRHNLSRLRKMNTLSEKVIFLARYVFPDKDFMHRHYQIPVGRSVALLYLYRPIELMLKLIIALSKRASI